MFGYMALVVTMLLIGLGVMLYKCHLRNAPFRKEKRERKWFITTLKKVVEELTAHVAWKNQYGVCHSENGKAYKASWVGFRAHGCDEWLFRYNAGDAKPECLTDSEWEQFTALLVNKFGRKTFNGGVEVSVKRCHATDSHEIQPYDDDQKPFNPADAILT